MAATEPHDWNQKFAEVVRAACIEAAISAIRMLNLRKLAESEEFEIR